MNIKRILILLFTAIALTSCSSYIEIQFNESDFIGKSSADITGECGAFDCTIMPISDDGLYRNARCGYTICESPKGFLGTSPEKLFFITFDENGIAVEFEIGYRPGG